jgi:hypothetical protein
MQGNPLMQGPIKNIIIILIKFFIKIFNPLLMRILKFMAFTGEGTDSCLKHGFLPVPIHFYQPIPDIKEMEKRNIWDKISNLSGINLEPEKCIAFIKQLASEYAHECKWPNEQPLDPKQFHLNNDAFGYGCAAPLHCLIRNNKPKRIIEIGSGYSSKIIAAAINLNARQNHETHYTIIDPYSCLKQENFPKNTNIIRQPVELLGLNIFESLEENDILFIDSSHVCKMGSDCNFEILEILPILNKGVYIHFHDIPLPFEYPKIYATNPNFRVFWTESYLLQAFLICNNDFQIIIPMSFLQKYHLEDLKNSFPHSSENNLGWISGSFWIKRIKMFGKDRENHTTDGHNGVE